MNQDHLKPESRALVNQFLSRRGLLGVAAGTAALTFGFAKTREIAAQQLDGNSLYDQLGGLTGIAGVINAFIPIVAADDRINSFFAGTVAAGRAPRLAELLIQQVAEASGGPVRYTGLDMKTAHTGMNITMAAFTALVEDLVKAMDEKKVPAAAQQTLLGALAPMAADIVTA